MWFAAYVASGMLFLFAWAVALISGFDTVPTLIAAAVLTVNMLIMRFAPRD